jgi:hypothetical protein
MGERFTITGRPVLFEVAARIQMGFLRWRNEIFEVVPVTAVVGFLQEAKAENAADALAPCRHRDDAEKKNIITLAATSIARDRSTAHRIALCVLIAYE